MFTQLIHGGLCVFDIVLESLRALILIGILVFFIRADKDVGLGRKGFLFIKFGFLLLIFGAFMDITDNFESLNWTVVAGDTPVQAFLEKIVGYLGGSVMLAIGFWFWLPTLHTIEERHDDMVCCQQDLEKKVRMRTHELEKEVDKRTAAEAQLRMADERRMALYEDAPVAIAHGLIGGSMVERNHAFATMLGYESTRELEEAVKAHNDPFLVWPDREDVSRMIKRLQSEKDIKGFEAHLSRKDGTEILVSFNFRTLKDRDGENYYFYAFAEDITTRKAAEERRASNEVRLKSIMDTMPAGLFLVDVETRNIHDVNQAMLNMTGYTREELVGIHCCEKLCPQDDKLCPKLDKGEEIVFRERMITKSDGSLLPIIKTIATVTLNDVEYLLETFVDNSEQKRLEHLKEDVDRIVAHDIKSPVINVISACDFLLMDDTMGRESRDVVNNIKRQARKPLRLLGMSLAIYKMEAGAFSYDSDKVDYLAAVRHVAGEADDALNGKSVTLKVLVGGEPLSEAGSLFMDGNEILFESMIANLLNNAIDASPIGGTVSINLDPCDPLKMAVINTGVVPKDVRSTFFDKYTTSGKQNGTGLGTYSASLVAKAMGGDISMETSDEADLTTVTVTLPCK